MKPLTDIEIAQKTELQPIVEIAQNLGIREDDLEPKSVPWVGSGTAGKHHRACQVSAGSSSRVRGWQLSFGRIG